MNLRQETDNSSLSLAFHLLSQHSNSNLVFSPLSIHVLLGMIAAGSKGPARDQILGFLNTSSDHELSAFFSEIVGPLLADGSPLGGPVLSTANGLWADLSLNLKPAFQDLLHHVYGAVSEHVDFQHKAEVIDQVNKWGSKETNGLIKDILPPNAVDNPMTMLILANAVYFKGAWSQKFDASLTKERDFYLLNGSSVRAPLMSSNSKNQYYFRAFDGFKVLRLPYEHGGDSRRFSMYICLPDAKDGLPALRERVFSQSGFINAHLPFDKEKLDELLIPKFKFAFDFEASSLLKSLGLGLEVTEMVECPSLRLGISSIYHKSLVEVNEEGTEAAAVSAAVAVGSSRKAVKRERVEFVADHPFLFIIREDTNGIVLFIGQLLNPLD